MADGKGGRVDLGDANAGQEDSFRREGGVELAKEEQRAAVCEQEDWAIPANVVKGTEGVGDARDLFGDDGSILRDFVSMGLMKTEMEMGVLASATRNMARKKGDMITVVYTAFGYSCVSSPFLSCLKPAIESLK
jgi:hypothetical protein